jgi:hypothetical protein
MRPFGNPTLLTIASKHLKVHGFAPSDASHTGVAPIASKSSWRIVSLSDAAKTWKPSRHRCRIAGRVSSQTNPLRRRRPSTRTIAASMSKPLERRSSFESPAHLVKLHGLRRAEWKASDFVRPLASVGRIGLTARTPLACSVASRTASKYFRLDDINLATIAISRILRSSRR